ncbi:acyltransferase family protein [Streptomyces jumonjinensis]|uniref:Acyltransferase n=1 Tax=Streptomyces jumonjinensis TaxID=1945 RepID=A0A646KQR6_STRJU|nr:acyltransferase [Streptomyces jumonjinensis]MQT04418.1 acyltransferase [Streptomyces jumonjinensis]
MTSSTTKDGPAAVHKPTLLPSLTSLRFFVAVIIFLFHATGYVLFTSPDVSKRFVDLVTMGGWAGMSFFFMLSGYVLTWVARPTDRAGGFWRRRLVRVFPNHLVMLAVTAILMVTVLDQVFDERKALLNVLLLQAWSPHLDVRTAFNSVSWSLSAELLFYLCFPVLLTLVRRIRPERLWTWTIGLLTLITLVVPLAVNRLPHREVIPFVELGAEQFWIIFHFPPVRMLEFVVGILLARIVITGRRVPVSFGGAAALTVAAYAVGPLFPPVFRMVAVMAAPLALLIAAAAVSDLHQQRPTLLSSRPMVYLGNLSYAFYLVHLQVLVYGSYWLDTTTPGSTPFGIAVLVLLFAVAVALSWLLFAAVEQPMMRRFGSKPRAPKTPPQPSGPEPAAPADRTPATAGAVAESSGGIR